MDMAGVTAEHFGNDPEMEAFWRAKRVSLAPVLTFWVGIIFLLLSISKAGNLIKYVSHSVMTGFVSAAGLFIGLSQLPQIFGIALHGEFPKNYMLFQFMREHNVIAEGSK
jgi:MFS superfamily sulfate permease-like transporter